MPEGPFGGPRPFAESNLSIIIEVSIVGGEGYGILSAHIDDNKERLEDELSFRIEDEISSEFIDFGVDRVLILFARSAFAFRIETDTSDINAHNFHRVASEIFNFLEEEDNKVNADITIDKSDLKWRIGTGKMGLHES